MQIKVWNNFSKRNNSTKQPSSNTGNTIDVLIKESTSIESPSFILQLSDGFDVNYIQAFNHYYFVNNTTILDNNHVQIDCTMDKLGTFKSEIQNTTARVIYSSSNYNLDLDDRRMFAEIDTIHAIASTNSIDVLSSTGCYILGAMNGESSGIVTYYALTGAQIINLSNTVLNDPNVFTQLKNQFLNPKDALVSCMWVPIAINSISGDAKNVYLGALDTGIGGKRIYSRKIIKYYSLSPNFAQGVTNYQKCEPYTTMSLFLPFVGIVPIDYKRFYPSTSIAIKMTIDAVTGDVLYSVGGTYDFAEMSFSGNCATNIPLSSSTSNATGFIGGGLTAIGGGIMAGIAIASGGSLAPATLGAIGGLATSIKSMEIKTQINGTSSSAIGIENGDAITIHTYTHALSDDMTAYRNILGLPCGKTLKLSTLSGYVVCENASIDLSGHADDRNVINSFLNGGFYLE